MTDHMSPLYRILLPVACYFGYAHTHTALFFLSDFDFIFILFVVIALFLLPIVIFCRPHYF